MADQFDKWLSDTLPETHEDPVEARIHLAILRDRLRRKRRRRDLRRFMAVAVPALAAVIFLGQVGDLGSDDFAMARRASEDGSTEVLVQGLQEIGSQVLPGEDESRVAEIFQQRAAGEATLGEVEGWEVGGKVYWSLDWHYRLGGEIAVRHAESYSPPSELTPGLVEFFAVEWDSFRTRVENGSLAPSGMQNVVLDGVSCTVRTYVLRSKESGEVVYYLGGPIP